MRKCSTRISVTRISGRGKCVMNDRNRKKNKVNCEQADTQRTTALMIIIYITISIPRECYELEDVGKTELRTNVKSKQSNT